MRSMSLVEVALRRAVPWAAFRPAVGGLAVGALAILTPGVLSSGHGVLHFVLSMEVTTRALLILLLLKTMASAVSIGSGFRGACSSVLGKLFAVLVAWIAIPAVDPML